MGLRAANDRIFGLYIPHHSWAFMDFNDYDNEQSLARLWNAVKIVRDIPYTLFTFGDSELRYFLVLSPQQAGQPVKLRQGEIRITRPLIITPESAQPDWQDFFESSEDQHFLEFLMARSAAFSNLRLANNSGPEQIVTDQPQELIDRLNQQLDREEEDRIAILAAPEGLAGVALIRFAAERIMASAPGNLNELRERGLLP